MKHDIKKILLPAAFLLFSLLELLAADAGVVARSGETEVLADDLRGLLEGLDSHEQAALAQNPAALKQAVRAQIAQKIVLKEALAKKWDKRPETQAQLERLRQNLLVESYLRSISAPPESYPSEAELKAAYETARESLRVPKQYRLAQIFIPMPRNSDKAADEKVRARLEPIRRQPDAFAAFARSESGDKLTAPRGGDIGWVAESQIQTEIRLRVISLASNTVTEPLRLFDGWHLIKMTEVKESYIPSLEDIREPLARQLRLEKTRANSEAYLTKLLQDNPVSINEIALAQEVGQINKAK